MDNLKKDLPSGAILEASMCSFEEGTKLFKAVVFEMESINLDFGNADLKQMFEQEVNSGMINTLKNIIARLISSERVEECLWQCMKRSRIDNQHITKELFEKVELRGDYVVLLKEILIFNLSPFFKSLTSMLQDILKVNIKSQK